MQMDKHYLNYFGFILKKLYEQLRIFGINIFTCSPGLRFLIYQNFCHRTASPWLRYFDGFASGHHNASHGRNSGLFRNTFLYNGNQWNS